MLLLCKVFLSLSIKIKLPKKFGNLISLYMSHLPNLTGDQIINPLTVSFGDQLITGLFSSIKYKTPSASVLRQFLISLIPFC